MNAYRNYNNNTSALSKNLEKLSSGYKINRAGDDAAGLAISEKMRAQITGLEAAQKNVKDGISLVKTAEGAMQEIQDMLNRMDYLATQSANGTYDNDVDRANLQKEVDALKSEINRIADSANFNGIKLLDGTQAADTSNSSVNELSGGKGVTSTTDGVFSIVGDGQLGTTPTAGKFTYDLSQLKATITVSGGKVTATATTHSGDVMGLAGGTEAGGTITPGTNTPVTPGTNTPSTPGSTSSGLTVNGSTGKASLNIGGFDIEVDLSSFITQGSDGKFVDGTYEISGEKLVSAIADGLKAAIAKAAGGSGTTSGSNTPSTQALSGDPLDPDYGGNAADFGINKNAGINPLAGGSVASAWGSDGKLAGAEVDVSYDGTTLIVQMKSAPTVAWGSNIDMTLRFSDGSAWNGGEQFAPTVEIEPVDSTQSRMLAQAKVDLNAMNLQDGSTLKLGNTTYTFAIGSDSKFKNAANVVDLTNVSKDDTDLAKIAANRLTQVAKNNKTFMVGSTTQGVISLTEREGAIDYTKNNLAGENGKGTQGTDNDPNKTSSKVDSTLNDWAGLVSYGVSSPVKGGLTLQIGDTSDDFNQLNVTVGDMHTKAMGIADVDISSQEGAASAIQTIRDAINYVSSVRGDLGAVQNRLEHTQNNLSVMAENIQDAESTIRDTDVAEEMMSYVKNNILVQSAQAMLAQANQVPQGVLQLLG